MTELAKLVVKLEAQSAKLGRDLDKANKRAKRWETKTKKSVNNVKGAFAALGVGIAAIKFKNFIQNQITVADTIGKTADKLGIGTKALQEYRFAAEQSGVNTKTLDMGMQRFTRRVAEAQQGQGELKQSLIDANIALRDSHGNVRTSEAILYDYADAIKNAESKQERLRLAFKGFDSEGAALVNLFKKGAEGVKEYARQANDAGLIIEDSMIRNAEDANDRMNILSNTISTKLTIAVVDNAEEIENMAQSLISFVNVAAQAPKFVRFLSESLAAMIHGPADIVRIDDRINKLRVSINQMSASLLLKQQTAGKGGMFGRWLSGVINDSDFENIQKLGGELAKLIERRDAMTLTPPAPLNLTGQGDDGGDPIVTATAERNDVILQMEWDLQDKLAAVRLKRAQEYSDLVKHHTEKVKMFRENAQNHAINLLSALGQKSKAFAIAAILVEKGMAIQRVLIQSKVAAMAALTPPPIGLGPVAGAPLAASITASGYASAGFIGATGAVQLAGLGDGGGGGSVGSSTTETSQQLDTALERQSGVPGSININITGGIADRETAEAIAESLRELFADGGRQFA